MTDSTDFTRPCPRAFALLVCLALLTPACGDDDFGYHDKVFGSTTTADADTEPEDAGLEDAGLSSDAAVEPCRPAVASDRLPAREAVMADELSGQATTDQGVFTKALFDEFVQHCGSCHAGTVAQGGLTANFGTFPQKIGKDALARIRSDQPGVGGFMPPAPGGVPFSQRGPDDPIRAFAARLEQWIAQGSPADVFFPKNARGSNGSGAKAYSLTKSVGMRLTNLGNCIPAPYLMAKQEADMAARDEKFAAMQRFQDLPKSLADTDLFTLDAEVLAEHGVIAFAPAYTLWADNAKKLRMVRVPRGQSIRFDSATQSFDIPPNTRFYKTFFKETVDLNGNKRYRKMETRIIVARPARLKADGTYEQTGLFGTYKWNEAETEATLRDRPYRDGEGFRDEVFPYIVDERLDDQVLRKGPKNQLAARLEAGSMRNYAIPGFDRCMHCHLGAPKQDLVLGFIPLQIHRRPLGEGGVIEPAEQDELNQVQRLIDYGVITGITSPDQIEPLEASQGDRPPRNEHELNAQGYMLGNCAHCHNPNGFPSLKEPVLKDALNFMPGVDGGGIFQFPLDKFSPRTFRGEKQDIPMPYITPSLYDLSNEALGATLDVVKWVRDDRYKDTDVDWPTFWSNTFYPNAGLPPGWPLLSPWRSLIYRNVDAPFSYQEAGTIFPHMPMDTPGYDCRARQILGTWMVSIPARWKLEDQPFLDKTRKFNIGLDEFFSDSEPQPFVEVSPQHPEYERRVLQAELRVVDFQHSERYSDCPDPALDALDPVVASTGTGLPAPQVVHVKKPEKQTTGSYQVLAPARPHYFETDLRQDESWIIRRGDWYKVLVPEADDDGDPYNNDPYLGAQTENWQRVYDALQQTKLTDALKAMATTEVPFGLWVDKPECRRKFETAKVPKSADYEGASRPEWMQLVPDLKPDAPVYAISPGAQVFNMICSKCHGPTGDGQSSLASTMADLTGGLTRVANLRDGLFGPPSSPGANRRDPVIGFGLADAVGTLNGVPLTVDDWAARYAVWMGLGGTRANLPKAAVASIGVTDVLGVRSGIKLELGALDTQGAANMLEVAKLSCQALVPDKPNPIASYSDKDILFDPTRGQLLKDPALDGSDGPKGSRNYSVPSLPGNLVARTQKYYSLGYTGLIVTNGHAELWERLCTLDNPMPVRLVSFETTGSEDFFYVSGLYRRSAYPSTAPIGDGKGKVASGLRDDNISPWCVVRPAPIPLANGSASPMLVDRFEAYRKRTGIELPVCPDEIASLDSPGRIQQHKEGNENDDDVERWAIRGAMNAGMSVFVYLDGISKGLVKPKPAYNRCEELSP